MDFLGDDEAALAIIKTWGWGADARYQEYVPLTVPLNETINRLAMEGHSDPAGALLSLLCSGRLEATGHYRWIKYQNDYFQHDGIGEIPVRHWTSLKEGLSSKSYFSEKIEVSLQYIDRDFNEGKAERALWEWSDSRFSTAKTSSGDLFDIDYSEETFHAFDIEVRPKDIEGHCGSATADPAPAIQRNKGGAPPKYDWERAVAAIVFQWAEDRNRRPTSKTDVKNKLADWFASQDKYPSETLMKDRARWLFEEFQRRDGEGNNPDT